MRGGRLVLSMLTVACATSDPGGSGASAGHSGVAGSAASAGKSGAGGTSSGDAGRAPTGGAGVLGAAGASAGNDNGVGGTAAGAGGRSASDAGATSAGGARGGGAGSGGGAGVAGSMDAGGDAGSNAGAPSVVSYSTSFDTSESPLSERGAWHHDGVDWTIVQTTAGVAYGTQGLGVPRSGPEGYNDSYAYLAGFPADQTASAEIAMGTIDTSCTHEVEILLRWFDSEHVARGYECNLAFDGSYAQIVRWNGPVGDYTYLGEGSVPGGVKAGDTISASVVGSHITLSVNGTVRATADDATFADGNPGIGFWRGSSGCGAYADFGFVSFDASAIE
ncbi:MAG TPA: hypothetical protein VNN72_10950 [Polyangiaceae bacterium]|nr:hypothetical protein [Polyangiaceae bacterium]